MYGYKNESIISKWENLDIYIIFLYPGGDLDHSQNLLGSMLDQEPSHFYFLKI